MPLSFAGAALNEPSLENTRPAMDTPPSTFSCSLDALDKKVVTGCHPTRAFGRGEWQRTVKVAGDTMTYPSRGAADLEAQVGDGDWAMAICAGCALALHRPYMTAAPPCRRRRPLDPSGHEMGIRRPDLALPWPCGFMAPIDQTLQGLLRKFS